MGLVGTDPFAPPSESAVRRWRVIAVVSVLFVLALVLQGVMQWAALDAESDRTGQEISAGEFWWTYLAGVFTAWQAALLVVLVGSLVLGWILTHGNPEHAPEIERLQTEIERLEARVITLAQAPRTDGQPIGGPRQRSRLPWRRTDDE